MPSIDRVSPRPSRWLEMAIHADPTHRGPQAYAPQGAVALLPEAYGVVYDSGTQASASQADMVAVVPIRGPLMHSEHWWFDSYEAITARVEGALAMGPRAVVLDISSPGGLVSGCFETAREIRRMCDERDVPLYAYVNGQATSAAYALACSASSVWCPEAGVAGSIGVIAGLVDVTANDAAYGIRYAIVTSGARKADGHPHVAISDDALKATQDHVNKLAAVFFAHVAAERGITVEAVRGLEAGVLLGAEAKAAGLVDTVGTLPEMLSAIGRGERLAGPTKTTAEPTSASAVSAERNEPTMKTLLRALGLGDNASEAEALSAVQAIQGTSARILALTGKTNHAEAEATVIAWQVGAQKAAELERTIVANQKAQADAEASRLIDAATADGRLPPANRGAVESQYQAYGLDALKSTLALLPQVVRPATAPEPTEAQKANAQKSSADSLTDEDRQVARALGITEAEALANKKKALAINGGAA